MDITNNLGEEIDPSEYRRSTDEFTPLDRDATPYLGFRTVLESDHQIDGPYTARIHAADESWAWRFVCTAALDLSDRPNQTIPLFRITLPGPQGFDRSNLSGADDDDRSAYGTYLKRLFVETGNPDHRSAPDRLTGLGPIGRCVALSADQPVLLALEGIDHVPPQAQAQFFGVLEKARVQSGIEVTGDPEHLTVLSTTGATENAEQLDRKLRRLMGEMHCRDQDSL